MSILIFCLQQQGPDKPPTCRCILFSLRWKIPSHVRNSISGEKFSLTWEIPFHWALHLSNIHWWPAADTFLNPEWSLVSSKMVHYWNQIPGHFTLSPMQQCNNNSSNHNYIIKLCNKKTRLNSKMFTAPGCAKLFYSLLENAASDRKCTIVLTWFQQAKQEHNSRLVQDQLIFWYLTIWSKKKYPTTFCTISTTPS